MTEQSLKTVILNPSVQVKKQSYTHANIVQRETDSDLEIIANVGIMHFSLFKASKSDSNYKQEYDKYMETVIKSNYLFLTPKVSLG